MRRRIPTRPAGGPSPPSPRRPVGHRRSPLRAVGGALVALVLLVAAAAIGTVTGRESRSPIDRTTVRAGAAAVDMPVVFATPPAPLRLPGLALQPSAARTTDDGDGALILGVARRSGATLLPRAFERAVGDSRGVPEAVTLGNGIEAYAYRGLRAPGTRGDVTVFAAPTSGGVLTLACAGVARDVICDDVAASLRAVDARPLPVGPAAYGRRLDRVIDGMNAAAVTARAELAGASSAAAQATAAEALDRTYRGAANAVAATQPGPQWGAANRRIRARLEDLAAGYRDLAAAASAGDAAAFAAATAAITDGERRLAASLQALATSAG